MIIRRWLPNHSPLAALLHICHCSAGRSLHCLWCILHTASMLYCIILTGSNECCTLSLLHYTLSDFTEDFLPTSLAIWSKEATKSPHFLSRWTKMIQTRCSLRTGVSHILLGVQATCLNHNGRGSTRLQSWDCECLDLWVSSSGEQVYGLQLAAGNFLQCPSGVDVTQSSWSAGHQNVPERCSPFQSQAWMIWRSVREEKQFKIQLWSVQRWTSTGPSSHLTQSRLKLGEPSLRSQLAILQTSPSLKAP